MRKRWRLVAQLRIEGSTMNAVDIDVSKGKSMVAVMRPFGEVVFASFEISHTDKDLTDLAKKLKFLEIKKYPFGC